MTKRRLTALLLGLAVVAGTAAAWYWPTARSRAMGRVAALNGTYVEQWDDAESRRVNIVMLVNRPVTEEDLAALRDLRPLHRVLLDNTPVTDDGLAHLGAVEGLEFLSLMDTRVTDAGLVHLRGLKGLKVLTLRRTPVTDAGLLHLRELPHLEVLNVLDTKVTDRGIEELQRAAPALRQVYLHQPIDDD